MQTDIYERMFDANVRIEAAWPFPVGPLPEQLGDALSLIEELPAELQPLIAGWSDADKEGLFDNDGEAWDELCAVAARKQITGWIAVAAVPVFSPFGESGAASFSWGHYHTHMIFARSADALLAAAVEWGEATRATDMQERVA